MKKKNIEDVTMDVVYELAKKENIFMKNEVTPEIATLVSRIDKGDTLPSISDVLKDIPSISDKTLKGINYCNNKTFEGYETAVMIEEATKCSVFNMYTSLVRTALRGLIAIVKSDLSSIMYELLKEDKITHTAFVTCFMAKDLSYNRFDSDVHYSDLYEQKLLASGPYAHDISINLRNIIMQLERTNLISDEIIEPMKETVRLDTTAILQDVSISLIYMTAFSSPSMGGSVIDTKYNPLNCSDDTRYHKPMINEIKTDYDLATYIISTYFGSELYTINLKGYIDFVFSVMVKVLQDFKCNKINEAIKCIQDSLMELEEQEMLANQKEE